MTPEQFDIITDQRFVRLSSATIAACRAVIIDGLSAYNAEDAYKCCRGTVSRYVNKVHAELAFCEEVVNHAKANSDAAWDEIEDVGTDAQSP